MSGNLPTKKEARQIKAWKIMGGNSIIESNDKTFYISYNSAPSMGYTGSDETALVDGGHYYILDGDWRDQYERAIDKGLAECLKVYLGNIEHKSSWSETHEDEA